jgi:NTP pyrophosphatase (non-canonical NTP hydrolase)
MDFKEYQKKSRETAIYPNKGENYIYPTLGLVGEAGEVAEKIKKIIRDDNFEISEEKKEDFKKEIGDVLWYMAQLCTELDLSLEEVAELNIEKLQSRKRRNVIHGSGDNR